MLPNARRSLSTFTLILSISLCNTLASADALIVDDGDRTSLRTRGAWMGFSNQPAPTWNGTLTWANLTGATGVFNFTGTSVEVFGAFKPVGVWSMQSQYAIDGGEPTTFVPPQEVPAEAYNQSFYRSARLRPGQHTLVITNMGAQLWLDYFLVTDDGGKIIPPSGNPSSATTTKTTTSSTTEATTTFSSTRTAAHDGAGSTTTKNTSTTISASTSSSSHIPTVAPSQLNTSASAINASLPTPSPSSTASVSLSSPLPSPTSTPSPSVTVTSPPQGAETTQSPMPGTSHAVPTGLIAGVTIPGVVALVLLLVFGCRFCKKRSPGLGLGRVSYPFSGSTASMLRHPDTSMSFYGGPGPLRDSQHSATLLGAGAGGPRLSRPTSSLIGFVVDSYADRGGRAHSAYLYRRSVDGSGGPVTIAGGPGPQGAGADAGDVDAPSIEEAHWSMKSRPPPVYQAYGGGAA